jgi:hypothetical protein
LPGCPGGRYAGEATGIAQIQVSADQVNANQVNRKPLDDVCIRQRGLGRYNDRRSGAGFRNQPFALHPWGVMTSARGSPMVCMRGDRLEDRRMRGVDKRNDQHVAMS